MITHVLTLEEINKGFDLMHAGEGIRAWSSTDRAAERWKPCRTKPFRFGIRGSENQRIFATVDALL